MNKNKKKSEFETPAEFWKSVTKMLILFTGLLFHNIFVGIALGVAQNDVSLFIAIIFHQFFEGLGMGARVAVAKLKRILVILLIDSIFALSCPVGIAMGLIIKAKTNTSSDAYHIVDAVFQALSGGILIYISVVHMLSGYVETCGCDDRERSKKELHKWISFLGVLVGAAVMAVIGIWA